MLSAHILGRLAAALVLLPSAMAKDWEGEPYTWLYQFPLPIPPVKSPKMYVILEIHSQTGLTPRKVHYQSSD
jgi:hypothetical protein